MGVPATLADLDPIIANNSPSGSDPIGTNLDDYLRSHAGLIKQAYTAALMPVGTRMPFAQAYAPTGWTQVTDVSLDNRMLRVVSGAGAGVGGSHSPILMDVIPSHTHSVTTGYMSANASHAHSIYDNGHTHAIDGPGTNANYGGGYSPQYGTRNASSGASGTGISIYATNTDHYHAGTAAANAGASNWSPRYIDMIICAKN